MVNFEDWGSDSFLGLQLLCLINNDRSCIDFREPYTCFWNACCFKGSLYAIATKLGLHASLNKRELVSLLAGAYNATTPNLSQFEDDLKNSVQSTHPLHHQHYRDHFNGIDFIDHYWYTLQHKKSTIKSWKSKFIMSLIEVGVVNAFVLNQGVNCTFVQFASEIAIKGLPFFFLIGLALLLFFLMIYLFTWTPLICEVFGCFLSCSICLS